jgi:hypothetical protein
MSLSSSFPHGAPSLAEVVLQRTFAKPPQPFVDGEVIRALDAADDKPPADAVAKPKPSGSGTSDSRPGSGTPQGDAASTPSSATTAPGKAVDVRV